MVPAASCGELLDSTGASYHIRSAINKGDQTVLSLSDHSKAPQADPKDFFDNGSLKELEDSGFVKKLYSRR